MSNLEFNRETRKKKLILLVQLAIYTALEILMAITPLGSLPLFPGVVATLAHLPVVLAAISLGWAAGFYMGFLFGLLSFLVWTFIPPIGAGFLFSPFYPLGNGWSLLICFVPRILLGLIATGLYHMLTQWLKNRPISAGISAGVASFCHTILVLGGGALFFNEELGAGGAVISFIFATVGINGVFEIAIAAVLCAALAVPLAKVQTLSARHL